MPPRPSRRPGICPRAESFRSLQPFVPSTEEGERNDQSNSGSRRRLASASMPRWMLILVGRGLGQRGQVARLKRFLNALARR